MNDDEFEADDTCPECDDEGEIVCWNCGGSGSEDYLGSDSEDEDLCPECHGSGMTVCDHCQP